MTQIFSRTFATLMAISIFVTTIAFSESLLRWDFEDTAPGALPSRWKLAENHGAGKLAKWEVIKTEDAASGRQIFALTHTENPNPTFNLAISEEANLQNLQISVQVKALSGRMDQGGGPIWRVQDPDNYYIARWNPLENNFRVYQVKAGKRTQIAGADVELDAKAWQEITIKMAGSKITASLNGKQLIEVEDTTFTQSGHIGLWTKADATTAFDNLVVEEVK